MTSTDFSAPGHTVVKLPYKPLGNDEADIMLSRFQNRDEIAVEEVMFLTALEIARSIADQKGRGQTVYMVGFDFTPDSGPARAATTQYSPDMTTSRKAGSSCSSTSCAMPSTCWRTPTWTSTTWVPMSSPTSPPRL